MPANIDITAATSVTYVWSHGAAITFDAQFGHNMAVIGDGASMAAASETAESATDSGGIADTLYISPAIDLPNGGNLVGGSVAMIDMKRDATNASDTLDIDARLHGIILTYSIDSGNEG